MLLIASFAGCFCGVFAECLLADKLFKPTKHYSMWHLSKDGNSIYCERCNGTVKIKNETEWCPHCGAKMLNGRKKND